MGKGGRPPKVIDQKQFEKLCAIQCTLEEMVCVLDANTDTIEKWCKNTYGMSFSEVFKIKRGMGKVSLRRSQFQLAEKNPTMAIWLGKQYLGQTDKQEVALSATDDSIKEMEAYFDRQKASARTSVE